MTLLLPITMHLSTLIATFIFSQNTNTNTHHGNENRSSLSICSILLVLLYCIHKIPCVCPPSLLSLVLAIIAASCSAIISKGIIGPELHPADAENNNIKGCFRHEGQDSNSIQEKDPPEFTIFHLAFLPQFANHF